MSLQNNIVVITAWILGTMWSVLTFLTYSITFSAAYLSIYKSCYMYASMRMEKSESSYCWGVYTFSNMGCKRCLSCIEKHTKKLWTWTFAKHVFPEMCSVFFAPFLIFWWKSKSVFFSRGKRKIRKNNNKIQHENLNQQRSPTRQDIRTRRSEFEFCHALKGDENFCFR